MRTGVTSALKSRCSPQGCSGRSCRSRSGSVFSPLVTAVASPRSRLHWAGHGAPRIRANTLPHLGIACPLAMASAASAVAGTALDGCDTVGRLLLASSGQESGVTVARGTRAQGRPDEGITGVENAGPDELPVGLCPDRQLTGFACVEVVQPREGADRVGVCWGGRRGRLVDGNPRGATRASDLPGERRA